VPEALTVLLDQNVPRTIALQLRTRRAQWTIYHTSVVALSGCPDEEVFAWAQQRQAVLERLLDEVPDAELARALIIIDRDTMRIRWRQ